MMLQVKFKFSCKSIQSFIIQKSSKYSMNVSVQIQCKGLALRCEFASSSLVILPLVFAKQQDKHQILE